MFCIWAPSPIRFWPCRLCSVPADPLLDGTPPLQVHGHAQPDASAGKAQSSPYISGRHVRPAAAQSRRPEDDDPEAQEAQLGQQEVRSGAAVQREGGGGVHPRGGTQPAGAQRGSGAGREDPGPAWGQTDCG